MNVIEISLAQEIESYCTSMKCRDCKIKDICETVNKWHNDNLFLLLSDIIVKRLEK